MSLLADKMEAFHTKGNASVGEFVDITRRLIDLTYHDRDTSTEDREMGIQLIPGLISSIEESLKHHPNELEKIQLALQYHLNSARTLGYGSLSWKIFGPGVNKADFINIIIDPSSGPLIPDFLATQRDTWTQLKPLVLRELILDRRRTNEYNAVLMLSGLVSGYDMVAWNVLTENERESLLNVSNDYVSARDVLVKYSLLPRDSGAIPLTPNLDEDFLELMVIIGIKRPLEIQSFLQSNEYLEEKFASLNDALQDCVTMLVATLRLKLWMDIIEGEYGQPTRKRVEKQCMENVFLESNNLSPSFEWFLDKFTLIDGDRSPDSQGPDYALATVFTDREMFPGLISEGDVQVSEEEELQIVTNIANILNYCRVSALQEYRHTLRYYSKYPPTEDGRPAASPGTLPWALPEGFEVELPDELPEEIQEDLPEEIVNSLYLAFGSWAPKVEQKLLLEDWIGYVELDDSS